MATKKKLLQAAAGAGGGAAGLDVSEVFSTYLYEGTGSARTITNGIDLSGEGGLVWFKSRDGAYYHWLFDTERGAGASLKTNDADIQNPTLPNSLTSFNSDGFSVVSLNGINNSGGDICSFTFRKAPRFFDIVEWDGNGVAGRQIAHNLGSVPGAIFVKLTYMSAGFGRDWMVYHRGSHPTSPEDYRLHLNLTNAAYDESGDAEKAWNGTAPTDTHFTVGNDDRVNSNYNNYGWRYVAYIFAHNDGDGEFGPDGDADIIKCGSYTGNNIEQEINLGFEPQWILLKLTNGSDNWYLYDTMRGLTTGGDDELLRANTSQAAGAADFIEVSSTGFKLWSSAHNGTGETFMYIAIRRGPMAVPTDATEVFDVDANGGTSSSITGAFTSGFPVDLVLFTQTTGANKEIISRINSTRLITNLSNAENASSRADDLDFMDGFGDGTFGSDYAAWMWKRAPSFFDAVAYTGNSTAGRTISHNLGVAPEMMWVKRRDAASGTGWFVSHKDLTSASYYLNVNSTAAESAYWNAWSSTAPTSSVFSLGNYSDVNLSGGTYIAYLFASLDGISRVGSVTHTFGTTTNVDCGFSSGARFVLMKSSSDTGPWRVWDSTRGIVAGNDPYLHLDDTQAEITNGDLIDPYSSGFAISPNFYSETVIYYAIA